MLGKLANIAQLLSTPPATIGIAWIISMFSQNVPFISAFGWFGILCSWLTALLILSLIVGTLRLNAMPLGSAVATWTNIALPEAAVKNVVQARFIIGILFKKLPQCQPGIDFVTFHIPNLC